MSAHNWRGNSIRQIRTRAHELRKGIQPYLHSTFYRALYEMRRTR